MHAKPIVLKVRDLHHHFNGKKVLFDVNLNLYEGEFVAIVGPSGCGKSTLLNAIVGTLKPSEGIVVVQDGKTERVVTRPGRDRGIVYQAYSLFDFLTAEENVAFGPLLDQTGCFDHVFRPWRWKALRKQHLAQAAALLQRFGLESAMKLYPHQMSGGMRQRVAVAQALIMKPRLLLLDEPFGALDEATREDLQWMMRDLGRENREAAKAGKPPPYTIVIVTHEMNEGLFVSDRLLGLSQYWDWKSEGFPACPGATIVYDQASPVYELKAARDLALFEEQRRQIIDFVFQNEVLQPRHNWVQVHERLARGRK